MHPLTLFVALAAAACAFVAAVLFVVAVNSPTMEDDDDLDQ